MNGNVNLILPKDKEFLEQQKRNKIVDIFAIAFPIIVGLISIIIFLATQRISPVAIRKQQDDIINQISKLQGKKVKLSIINDRLENIGEILKKRRDFASNINDVLVKMSNKILLENLAMDNKEISLTISSSSLTDVNNMIDDLINMAKKKEVIRSLSLESLSFDENKNSYLIALKSEL